MLLKRTGSVYKSIPGDAATTEDGGGTEAGKQRSDRRGRRVTALFWGCKFVVSPAVPAIAHAFCNDPTPTHPTHPTQLNALAQTQTQPNPTVLALSNT